MLQNRGHRLGDFRMKCIVINRLGCGLYFVSFFVKIEAYRKAFFIREKGISDPLGLALIWLYLNIQKVFCLPFLLINL